MAGITQHEVSAACERLISNPKGHGERDITFRKVRAALGDRGSNTTIGPMIDVWRKQRHTRSEVAAELSGAVARAIRKAWESAVGKRLREVDFPIRETVTVSLGRRSRGLSGRLAVSIALDRARRPAQANNSYDVLTEPAEDAIRAAARPLRATEILRSFEKTHPDLYARFDHRHISRSMNLIPEKGALIRLKDGRWATSEMSSEQKIPLQKAPKYKQLDTTAARRRRGMRNYVSEAINLLKRRKSWMSAADLFKILSAKHADGLIILREPEEIRLTAAKLHKALYLRHYHRNAPIERQNRLFRYATAPSEPEL